MRDRDLDEAGVTDGGRAGSARRRVAAAVVMAAGVGVLWGPTSASATRAATAVTMTEYAFPTSAAGPNNITAGPDGNLWATENFAKSIARITPAGSITEFPVPGAACLTGITGGPDGNVWFTDQCANFAARVTPAGVVTEFPVPNDHVLRVWARFGVGQAPQGITSGPDGNLWIAEFGTDRVVQLHPDGTYGADYILPRHPGLPKGNPDASGPDQITAGPDGNLWFTESRFGGGRLVGNHIARMTLAGVFTEFEIPTLDARPRGIAAGPGNHLWFTELLTNKIAKIDMSGDITEFRIDRPQVRPDFITRGPDNAMWFTEASGAAPGLARVGSNGEIKEFAPPNPPPFPQAPGAIGITLGPDSNIWFTEFQPNHAVKAVVTH